MSAIVVRNAFNSAFFSRGLIWLKATRDAITGRPAAAFRRVLLLEYIVRIDAPKAGLPDEACQRIDRDPAPLAVAAHQFDNYFRRQPCGNEAGNRRLPAQRDLVLAPWGGYSGPSPRKKRTEDPAGCSLPVSHAPPVSIFLVDFKRNPGPDINPFDVILGARSDPHIHRRTLQRREAGQGNPIGGSLRASLCDSCNT